MKSVYLPCAALLIAMAPVAFAQTSQVPSSHSAAPAVSSHSRSDAGTMNSTAKADQYSADNAQAGQEANAGGIFTTVPSQEDLSSKVVGLNVYNSQNTKLGTIKDIAFDP